MKTIINNIVESLFIKYIARSPVIANSAFNRFGKYSICAATDTGINDIQQSFCITSV